MDKTKHLTTDDLILFMDREIDAETAAAAERHLLNCGECAQRLASLKRASGAYDEYRAQVLEPALNVPTTGWARLSRHSREEKRRRWGLIGAAACACGLALVLAYMQLPGQPNAQEVLNRAVTARESTGGTLVLTTGRYRFLRPATLEPGNSEARLQHVRLLFVQANYSWENPLSARSFADWRRRLPQKEDSVTSIREPGGPKFYRLRTRTSTGVLRAASLTLRAETFHATKADFEFQGEDPVELAEQIESPRNGPQEVHNEAPASPQPQARVTETAATPEDELKVFAALSAIGADVEEPIDVKLDAENHSVIVTGMGISPVRRKEIETAMAALPNTIVRFSGREPTGIDTGPAADLGATGNANQSFRQRLEDRYGGARQLQAATDKTLDTSNALFARAHSLMLLAREFPPAVEARLSAGSATSLLSLRQRHVGAMEFALRQLKAELQPLTGDLPPESRPASAHWQEVARDLFTTTRNLDGLLSRLLAGSYTEQAGEQMLHELPDELLHAELLLRAQAMTRVGG